MASKWNHREMVLVSEKTSWDAMLQQGNAGKSRRLRRGFATGKFRENVFVCWLGKGSPKVAVKTRKFVDPGSHVADDVMLNVPVVPVAERPGVTADIKMEVMKNSTWAGKAEGDDEDMDASGSDSSDVGGETPASKSKNKTDVAEHYCEHPQTTIVFRCSHTPCTPRCAKN